MKVATNIVSIFLAVIIVFNSSRISLTYAFYYLDTSGFIERLCVNKDKPEMNCNGNCHLKKVVESNKTDDKIPLKVSDFREITLIIAEKFSYKFINNFLKKTKFTNYNNLYAYSVSSTLDRPPQS